ncbi:hypothetical protein KSP35_17475 [Aquihabitans sp. G128]|uniref:hypothetical protein n=1 Tax=Aquihabitans sp. G128 TaxID=2849779 RepID=UPI001C24AC94|nr:hypothetical protein [Aquihabitans sp. G128]QXC60133.1 hypothetical protein KSP35_17475 [Aquihabitans sp. G128]
MDAVDLIDRAAFEAALATALDRAGLVDRDLALLLLAIPEGRGPAPEIVASALWLHVRTNDIVCHLGGRMFGILLDTDADGARVVASRIQAFVGDLLAGPTWLGLVAGTGADWTADGMLASASTALSRALDAPGGRIEVGVGSGPPGGPSGQGRARWPGPGAPRRS